MSMDERDGFSLDGMELSSGVLVGSEAVSFEDIIVGEKWEECLFQRNCCKGLESVFEQVGRGIWCVLALLAGSR